HRVDARGRLERVRYDDEGNPVERTDAAGHVTRTEYGPFDLVLATVDAAGARTSYEYDAELRLTRVTDPRGLEWRYTYDPAGRLVEEVDFNGRRRRYDYDAAGQLIRSTNGLGEATEYEHDLLGNVVERRTVSGTTRYRYDAVGRLVAAENADAELVIERDEAGRVVAHTTNGRTLAFRYDDRTGARHRRTPNGSESVWAYDPFGNLDSLVTAGHTLGFRHDGQGRELRRSLDGRVVLEQTFGTDRQLAAQVLPGLRRRRFDYRADGQLAGIDEDGTGRVDFTLDEAGRVLAVRGAGRVEDYRYDPTGNLTSARVSGLPYAGELRYDGSLVTEAGGVRYRYDAQGRMVSRTLTDPAGGDRTWHFEWDAHDRLVWVRTPDGDRWRYRYDPLGRRIAKQRFADDDTAPVEQVDFVWDGSLLVEQAHTDEHGRTRVTTWEYHPDEQRPVAQTVRDERDEVGERFYAIVTDLVGTPTDLVDADGELAWRNDASLWGAVPGGDVSGVIPLRFPGQYLDPETGLHYNVYRYYDPISGRYVSQDPLGLAPAPDPAGYVPNPYAAADPLGLACTAGSSSKTPGSPGGGTDARNLPDTAGSSGGNRPRPDQRPDDLSDPDAELYDLSNPIHLVRPIQPNPPRPTALLHGSSAPPNVVFQDGLKSRYTQEIAGTPEGSYVQPHFDLFKHMHNGKGSGFVSTTGSQDAALSFVRPTPLPDRPGFKKGTAADGTTYDHHDGYLYVVDNDLPAVHAPSQNLPPVLDRVRYQDEWSVVGDIPPDRIIKAIHIEGYYNTKSGTMPDPYRPGQTIPTVSLEFPNDPKLGTVQTVEHNPNYGRRR
ncbi:RHS repeat-associated core domain-containing protein, partial [Micromonospora azadirachtae]